MEEPQPQTQPAASPPPGDEQQPPGKIKRFIKETIRVLRITKKPDQQEYKSLLKVTGLGIAAIGALGFIIFLVKQLLFR